VRGYLAETKYWSNTATLCEGRSSERLKISCTKYASKHSAISLLAWLTLWFWRWKQYVPQNISRLLPDYTASHPSRWSVYKSVSSPDSDINHSTNVRNLTGLYSQCMTGTRMHCMSNLVERTKLLFHTTDNSECDVVWDMFHIEDNTVCSHCHENPRSHVSVACWLNWNSPDCIKVMHCLYWASAGTRRDIQ
jgi:hypothetical protein